MRTILFVALSLLWPHQGQAFLEESFFVALSEDEKAALISGPIDELPGTTLAAVIRDLPPSVALLQLESGGGRLDVALDAAREIRRRGFRTYTNVKCDSACTILFLAGRERSANQFTRFEFHRIQYVILGKPENGPRQAYWQGRASQYYLDFGLPGEFVLEVESQASTTKNLAELMRMGFVTKNESINLRFGKGRMVYETSSNSL